MKVSKSWFAPPSEPYYDWIGEQDEICQTYESRRLAFERSEDAEDWVAAAPDPSEMVDPELPPPGATPTPATPCLGLEDVERLMYEHNNKGLGPNHVGATHFSGLKHYPLALYRRFEAETEHVMEEHGHAADHDGKPLTVPQAKEIVYRQWEHIFSSRMPEIAPPIPTWKGETHDKNIRYDGEWTWELLFMRRFLAYLKLIGDPQDHPSRAIKMPKALGDLKTSHTWINYIRSQGLYFEKMLGERNSWLPFLLTRPFVVFSVFHDNIQGLGRHCYSRALLCQVWRNNGWWNGGHSHSFQDFDGPGWTWPDESPSYVLEDLPPTLMTSWNLWLGDPDGPQQRLNSPPPRSVTEEELKDDPDLRKRKTCISQIAEYRQRERTRLAMTMTKKARAVYEAELNSVPSGMERQQLDFDMYYVVGPGAKEPGCGKLGEDSEDDSEDDSEVQVQVQAGAETQDELAPVAQSSQSSASLGRGRKRPRASLDTTEPNKRSRKAARPVDKDHPNKPTRSTPPAAIPSKLSPRPRRSSRVAARRG